MATGTSYSTLRVVWVTACLMLTHAVGCRGQYGTYGGMYHTGQVPLQVGGMPTHHLPGVYTGTYSRPAVSTGYSYGYTNTQMRSMNAEDEALDNAEKMAMQPLNNVMSSPPVRSDAAPPLMSLSIPSIPSLIPQQGRNALGGVMGELMKQSQPCGGNCQKGRSAAETTSSTKTDSQGQVTTETHQSQHQAEPANRQLPGFSGYSCCPCLSNYYNWMYSGYPLFDYNRPVYPKTSGQQNQGVYTTGSSSSPYYYQYQEPGKMASAKSARTFWLPWLTSQAMPASSPYSFQYTDPNYNKGYYGRRY